MFGRFQTSRVLKCIAWAFGTTSLVASVSATSAQAAQCTAVSTSMGGTSFATAANIGTLCGGSKIDTFADTLPRYWEFNWGGSSTASEDISGTVTTGGFGTFDGNSSTFQNAKVAAEFPPFPTGSFYGNLNLYNMDGTQVIAGSQFSSSGDQADSFTGTTRAALNGVTLTKGAEYVIAVEYPLEVDPAVTISFSGSPSTVPLPASLPLFGGALAAVGLLHRFRRTRASA